MSRNPASTCLVCGRSDRVAPPRGVADPAVLEHVLQHMAAIAKRYGRNVGVLHVQVDGLDALRAGVRDEAARGAAELRVVRRLRHCLRDSDVIAQVARDRYALALADLWEPEMIARVATRVAHAFSRPLRVGGEERMCPVRIGIALWPHDSGDIAELVGVAAEASDRLARGQIGIAYHDAELGAFALRQADVERALNGSEARELYELHYQPIFEIASGDVVGAEALVRWNRPGAEQLVAADFIDLAERTGRIASLDRWVIGAAARQAAEWATAGWTGWISVNLSGRTLDTAELASHFATAIERADADPRRMLVEVTETAAMRNRTRSMGAMAGLRELGVHVAVDDFGAGHASVAYLRDFNPDLVKLDKSFLQGLDGTVRNDRLMEGLIRLAHHLGKPVVAEGCESEAQMQWLTDAGCDLVQGYLPGRPSDAASFRARWIDPPPGPLGE